MIIDYETTDYVMKSLLNKYVIKALKIHITSSKDIYVKHDDYTLQDICKFQRHIFRERIESERK